MYGALLAKYSYYKKNNMLDDGWFYSTIPDLYESTSLSAFKQKRCITNLVNFGLIKCEIRGLPARRSFFIITDNELIKSIVDKGEEKIRSIKAAAALSCEKKRRPADERVGAECGYVDEDEEEIEPETVEEDENLIACDEETEQQAPKELDNLLQRNCETCSEISSAPSSLYKTKDNKTTVNNHQSINRERRIGLIGLMSRQPILFLLFLFHSEPSILNSSRKISTTTAFWSKIHAVKTG